MSLDSALSSGSTESLSRADSNSAAVGGASRLIDSSVVYVNHTSAPGSDGARQTTAPEVIRQREENEKLRKQLEKYRDVIDQQETFIQVRFRLFGCVYIVSGYCKR